MSDTARPASPRGSAGHHPPALQITNLVKSFRKPGGGRFRAVDELSLTVPSGEIVAFLGPNGAGKTTTLDIVLGLTQPDSGEVRVLGETPDGIVQQGRIAAVLQTGALLPDLSVKETVQMIGALYAETIGVDEALRRAGIEKIAGRKVSKCSGGEQQRLRFALALLPNPDLLVLDEPTAGMDVNARGEFWDAMRAEAHRGRTIIFATHYLKEAEDFAERSVLIAEGRLVADGAVGEIRELAGGKSLTARLDGATEAELQAVPGVQRAVRLDPQRIELKCDDADAAARYLLTNTAASDIEIRAASLDEAFEQLTAHDDREQS